jgi:hypothetical protein
LLWRLHGDWRMGLEGWLKSASPSLPNVASAWLAAPSCSITHITVFCRTVPDGSIFHVYDYGVCHHVLGCFCFCCGVVAVADSRCSASMTHPDAMPAFSRRSMCSASYRNHETQLLTGLKRWQIRGSERRADRGEIMIVGGYIRICEVDVCLEK